MQAMLDAMVYAIPYLMSGLGMTLLVSLIVVVLSLIAGVILGVGLIYGPLPLRWLIRLLTDCIRGIPILVQLFYIYFVFPEIGIQLSAFEAGVIGLGFAYSCYMAEVFRAGIEAVDPGQIEAAQSLGMGRALILWRVVLPQALKISLPPYGNTCVMLLKDTSQASIITVAELSFQGRRAADKCVVKLVVTNVVCDEAERDDKSE